MVDRMDDKDPEEREREEAAARVARMTDEERDQAAADYEG